jgi:hypothetical protein
MFKWRLYYADGSTFSDTDGAPHDSPPWGVVVVSQPGATDNVDRVLMNGDRFMYRTDLDRWHEVGRDGLDDHLSHFGHLVGCYRVGRWIPDRQAFKAIVARAQSGVA